MAYDFETVVKRDSQGSAKWLGMKKLCPDIPEDIVPFSIADMELKNPPEMIEGLKQYLDSAVLGYTGPTPEYWKSVVSWMDRRHSWKVDADEIVCTPGIVLALHYAVNAYAKPGEGIIIMTPVYYPFYRVIKNSGCEIVSNPLVDCKDHYAIDFDDLEAKAKDPKNTVLMLSNPHNPVGRVWTPDELERIGKICMDNSVVILSDEIHFDLIMPGYKHTVMANLSEALRQHTVTFTSPSKTFNIAGLQLSNIVIPNAELRKKFKASMGRDMVSWMNALCYKACQLSYDLCEPWLEELLKHLDHNRQLVEDFINERLPEARVYRLEGTYLQWIDLRSLGLDADALEKRMLDNYLFMDEGYIFGEAGAGFERLNLACPAHVIESALVRFEKAVKG